MAHVEVREHWRRFNPNRAYAGSKCFHILLDLSCGHLGVAIMAAAHAPGIPRVGDPFSPSRPWLKCVGSRRIRPLGPGVFRVICRYWGKLGQESDGLEEYR